MLRNKIIIAMVALSLLFTGMLPPQAGAVTAAAYLSCGDRGDEVAELQKTLTIKGYPCGLADAILGPKTEQAVVEFQEDAGLASDGVVGPETGKALEKAAGNSRSDNTPEGKTITMLATGYDDSWESNYPYYGQPSYIGLPLERGIVAVDPDVIPMGTRLYVEGYGEAIAADQGGAIQGNRIDLFFDSREEAMDWGMRTVEVTILE